jgi:hypothetical protein
VREGGGKAQRPFTGPQRRSNVVSPTKSYHRRTKMSKLKVGDEDGPVARKKHKDEIEVEVSTTCFASSYTSKCSRKANPLVMISAKSQSR